MLTKIDIKSFRGLRDLQIGPLKRVNLIMGQNNTGKTAVLEALVLLLSSSGASQNLPSLFRSAGGEPRDNFWKWLFPNKDLTRPVDLSVTFGSSEHRLVLSSNGKLAPEYQRQPLTHIGQIGNLFCFTHGGKSSAGIKASVFSTHPTNPRQDAVDYNRVVLRRKKRDVEGLLKKIEPRLEAIESLQTGSEPLLYADIGLSEMIPVTQMGQGFNRLLDIYSEIVAAEAKVLLIDEIENGLHHSVLPTIWRGLFHAAEEVDVQIFATTHSWECVLAADRAAREGANYELNLIRLDRVDDRVKATLIDQPALETAKELEWEMR